MKAAAAARDHAYAPYSGYRVGAAIEGEDGRVWCGCNVENASFGATMCAERVALFKLLSEGGKHWRNLAVFSEDGARPCGLCLQVLNEFTSLPSEAHVICVNGSGAAERFTFHELLPHPFAFAPSERKQQ